MKKIYSTVILLFALSINGISQSWTVVPFAPIVGRFDDMNFVQDSIGFVSQNSEVYKTTNRGQTWNFVSRLDPVENYYVRSIEFINDTLGFAGLLSSAFPLTGNLYKTTDGGLSWTLLQNMQIQSNDGICGMSHYRNSLIAVGTYSEPAWFYRTNDFGLSWTKVDLSAFASGLVDCFMINSDTILVSGIADAANQYGATILKSFDGGVTWQRVYLSSYPNSYCWKMCFRSNGLGLASLQFAPGKVLRTTDFGTTWNTQNVLAGSMDLGSVGLLNDTLGWVTDQYTSGTWETRDGGLIWNSIISPISAGDRMVILDSVSAIVAGETIYKYQLGTTGIQNPSASDYKKIHQLIIYPNPASEKVNIDAIAGTNTFGLLDILDSKGLLVQHVTRQFFKKGKNSFAIEIKNLAAGNYQLLWRNNELFVIKDFVVVK